MSDTADRTSRRLSPRIVEIPAGTRESICRGSKCRASFYFVDGKPIDPNVEGGKAPSACEPGRGILHHILCPSRDEFPRKPRA